MITHEGQLRCVDYALRFLSVVVLLLVTSNGHVFAQTAPDPSPAIFRSPAPIHAAMSVASAEANLFARLKHDFDTHQDTAFFHEMHTAQFRDGTYAVLAEWYAARIYLRRHNRALEWLHISKAKTLLGTTENHATDAQWTAIIADYSALLIMHQDAERAAEVRQFASQYSKGSDQWQVTMDNGKPCHVETFDGGSNYYQETWWYCGEGGRYEESYTFLNGTLTSHYTP